MTKPTLSGTMTVRVCLTCCNRAKGKGGRCKFCGGTIITDLMPR